jgi:hypothetical protein
MTRNCLLAALCVSLWVWVPAWAGQASLAPAAEAFARQAQAELARLDQTLAEAARDLAKRGLTGAGAREALRSLSRACPVTIDICTVDLQGRMVTIEPKGFHHLEGYDISAQEQVRLLWQTKRPVMSQVFRTVEGVEAVDMEHPILGEGGELLGAVSAIFRPEALLARAWRGVDASHDMEPWAMDATGRILYDQDANEVGLLLFDDDIYLGFPELLALGRRMLAERQGQGGYSFPARGDYQPVSKACAWATVELYGVWWRVAVAQPQR